MSALRCREIGDHAHRRLPVFLFVHRLRGDAAAQAGRLLRVLLLRFGALSPHSVRAFGRNLHGFGLRRISLMVNDAIQTSKDWLRSPRTSLLAWWLPQVAIIAGLFVPVPIRAVIWIIALLW